MIRARTEETVKTATIRIRASVNLATSELTAKQVKTITHLEENEVMSDIYY